ncbi:MAG TPA: cob(I)yrinic acid a,c-diamide adenosyltransferase [Anaerolineales bacterium]|nr:cob(I)yrinic acid a,c-diamide adenosyltransferase [Anaerolineales bacterium]
MGLDDLERVIIEIVDQFYTRTGDNGYTGVLGKGRVPKNQPRLEAIGAVDEAMAALGLARSTCQAAECGPILLAVQHDLYNLMAETSANLENADRFRKVTAERVNWLEQQIALVTKQIDIPNEFILPGDTFPGSVFALARTIVRRAERRFAGLFLAGEIKNQELLKYLNRLSSLCFVLELLELKTSGQSSVTLAKEAE